jgi:CHAT domain-containing protein
VFADPVFSVDDLLARAAASPGAPAAPGEPAAASPPATGRPSRAIVAERLPEGPLPRLPATAREAAAILARVPADLRLARLGPEATKQAVLGADLRPYRILHFATHAWIDERFPELSGLVLSTVDGSGRPIDGALYLHEIDRLELGADLVVLSGCQTALGRRVRGDGLLGLTQGFFHAGSSQVLVSLWSLDDTAAARLMDRFYGRMLERGETPAAALRHAQCWLRGQEDFVAPRFWAPFVLQGDG